MAAKHEKKVNVERKNKNNVVARRKRLRRKAAERAGLSIEDYRWADGRLYGYDRFTGQILGLVPGVPACPKFPKK